jgi:hypothetical protein
VKSCAKLGGFNFAENGLSLSNRKCRPKTSLKKCRRTMNVAGCGLRGPIIPPTNLCKVPCNGRLASKCFPISYQIIVKSVRLNWGRLRRPEFKRKVPENKTSGNQLVFKGGPAQTKLLQLRPYVVAQCARTLHAASPSCSCMYSSWVRRRQPAARPDCVKKRSSQTRLAVQRWQQSLFA